MNGASTSPFKIVFNDLNFLNGLNVWNRERSDGGVNHGQDQTHCH